MKEINLVYMVAGMSSRFGGKIKQFAKVGPNNSTLIEYSLQQALPAGFSKIIFIVGKMTEIPFKEMFGNNYKGIPVEYSLQTFDETTRDRPRGTVDALCSAKEIIDGPYIVCNGDDIYGSQAFKILVDHLNNSEESALVGYPLKNVLPNHGTVNRGILRLDHNNYIERVEEATGISKDTLNQFGLILDQDLCNMNIFAIHTDTINKLDNTLTIFKNSNIGDRKIECYLPVELPKVGKVKVYTTQDPRFGVTNPEDEEIVKKQIEEYENQ
ncbi:hypothetical protein K9M48_05005 [Candidatus Gracilibacteria bacterium]|nr:hypothetical protein [Candidatus Gracilibacteria bacterium]